MKKTISLLMLSVIAFAASAKTTWSLWGDSYTVDTLYHAKVGPGTTQTSLLVEGPVQLRVFYTTTDVTNPNLEVKHVMAQDKLAGLATVSSMAKSKSKEGAQYFVGINADFFSNSKPVGSAVVDKEVYYAVPWRTQWAMDADRKIYLGDMTFGGHVRKADGTSYPITAVNYDRNENNLIIYTPRFGSSTYTNQYGTEVVLVPLANNGILTSGETQKMRVSGTPATAGNMAIPAGAVVLSGHGAGSNFVATLTDGEEVEVETIVQMPTGEKIAPVQLASGCPMILSDGVVLDNDHLLEATPNRHPRTAVGYDETGTKMVMLVVDGRSSISAGAYPQVLGDIMREVGCKEAMNFDGGGSSTLYVQKLGVRNVPSEGTERTVTNGVYLVSNTPTDNEIAEIQFVDWVCEMPKYGYFRPKFYGFNKYGYLVDTDVQGVKLSCSAELGEVVENGETLFCNGGGLHPLTATYNGVTATLAVSVDDKNDPIFRHDKVVLNGYDDYKVDVYGKVRESDVSIENTALAWETSDASVATVDEKGIVKGLKNGKATIKGTVGDFSDEIEVTVEIPTKRYQGIDENLDPSTWTLECSSNVENFTIAPLGVEGMEVNYTTKKARQEVSMIKEITTWSRPDSVCIDINPGNAQIKNITLYLLKEGETEPWECTLEPTLKANELNRIEMPMDTFVNLSDMGAYPIKLTEIRIVPKGSLGTANLQIPRFSWVYNAVSADASGVEEVVKSSEALTLSPNPVEAGAVVKLGVTQAVKYTVSALNGAVVARGEGTELSTEGLSAGMYIVNAEGLSSARLLVK